MRPTDDSSFFDIGEPSRWIRKFSGRIIGAAGSKPIIDVACGRGRNALFFAKFGCAVICIDRDLAHLKSYETERRKNLPANQKQLKLYQLDLEREPWPFSEGSIGGIINVHFFLPSLFPGFENSLSPGGYLLFESVPGCGRNYLELPPAGYVRSLLTNGFELEVYRERKVGPVTSDTVTCQVVAKRKNG
jgi:SAM-dependent methyltransferase